jgi:hypothetical protein
MLLLASIVLVWPISHLGSTGLGIALEKTPAYGWIIDSASDTDFPGVSIGVYQGYCRAYLHGYAVNPKPPLPLPYMSWFGADESHWLGSVRQGIGIGMFLRGSLFSRYWTSCTGVIFPLWPLSLFSAILLIRRIRKRIRQHRASGDSFCPTCSYDLRMHHPGDKCPECGTPISSSSPPQFPV